MGLTLLFIAHDLSMVRYLSDRMAVMYLGSLVEMGPADAVFFNPQHPNCWWSNPELTRPVSAPSSKQITGEIPSQSISRRVAGLRTGVQKSWTVSRPTSGAVAAARVLGRRTSGGVSPVQSGSYEKGALRRPLQISHV